MGRNIVICCDGTGNQIAGSVSNVMRLCRSCVNDRKQQLVYYDPGVGTMGGAESVTMLRRLVRRGLDGAVAFSIRENVCEAYRFLVENWEHGDQLMFFGFSRGAYTVRALAGMIKMFGLVRPEHANIIPYIWISYSNAEGLSDDADLRFGAAARVRTEFSGVRSPLLTEAELHRFDKTEVAGLRAIQARQLDPKNGTPPLQIDFLGCWDTVASFGWVWNYRTLPYTRSNSAVRVVRHAVSIHERRQCFRHNLFGDDVVLPHPKNARQDCVQMLFSGAHADVGGGYPVEEEGHARAAFEWMAGEARAQCIMLDQGAYESQLERIATAKAKIHNQLDPRRLTGWMWRITESAPRQGWSSGLPSMWTLLDRLLRWACTIGVVAGLGWTVTCILAALHGLWYALCSGSWPLSNIGLVLAASVAGVVLLGLVLVTRSGSVRRFAQRGAPRTLCLHSSVRDAGSVPANVPPEANRDAPATPDAASKEDDLFARGCVAGVLVMDAALLLMALAAYLLMGLVPALLQGWPVLASLSGAWFCSVSLCVWALVCLQIVADVVACVRNARRG